ncbi:MarR family transcriptional regulator [archaeon]|jgi:hypothetical protein|nr:MarR family transcriptional regulator [archaeon]MBT6697976.1 MarR family transcriptional regulator [archaeon]
MKNKHVGYIIIAISALILIIVYSFNQALAKIVAESCSHGITCPMTTTLNVQKGVSYSLTALVALAGAIIAFVIKEKPAQQIHIHKTQVTTSKKDSFPSQEEQQKTIDSLANNEEKQIMQEIFKEKGSIYQSTLTTTLGLSKVKITRLLDTLEGKGLVERKRRGMTNVVVLKQ